MELRRVVKRPQRYEPELLNHLDPTYAPRSARPAFPIEFVDFNPSLPPARFPTLECPNAAEQSEHSQIGSSGSDTSTLDREAATRQQLWLDQAQKRLDLPYDALDGWGIDDGSQNRGPVGRLQLQDRRDHMDERFATDLDVSDEEGGKDDKARSKATPRWINLPIPLQLTILDAMSTNLNVGTVFNRLRLNYLERRNILWHQSLRGVRERQEDTNIETMHAEQLRLLLHDQDNGLDAIKRSEFGKTFDEYLYQNINLEKDYHTITKKNLADARTFLRRMGLDPDLAGEWSEMDDQDPAIEPRSVPASSNTGQRAGTKLKLIMSLPNEVPLKLSAVTKYPNPALAKSSEKPNGALPVKRVLFTDNARGPKKSTGMVTGPPSEPEFASIRILPHSNYKRLGI